MANKKKNVTPPSEVNGEVLIAQPTEGTTYHTAGLEPITDDFQIQKNNTVVSAVNTILANVQTLIQYLELAQSKGVFGFKDCADIYNSIVVINDVTDSLETSE